MSQTGSSKKQKPGCVLGIVLFAFMGIVGALLAAIIFFYLVRQLPTEDINSVEIQAPEIEQQADQSSPAENGEETNDIAGTYVGTTDLPGQWSQYPGTDFVNEITVIVASNGQVSGSLAVMREGDAFTTDNDCVTFTDFDVSGAPSGQLAEAKGTITIQMVYYFETRYTQGCASETDEFTKTYDLVADVIISGETMTGTIPEWFTFEATRH